VNTELEIMWKQAAMASSETLFSVLPGETEKYDENYLSDQSSPRAAFEPDPLEYKTINVTAGGIIRAQSYQLLNESMSILFSHSQSMKFSHKKGQYPMLQQF
jgi:hypothetical protein